MIRWAWAISLAGTPEDSCASAMTWNTVRTTTAAAGAGGVSPLVLGDVAGGHAGGLVCLGDDLEHGQDHHRGRGGGPDRVPGHRRGTRVLRRARQRRRPKPTAKHHQPPRRRWWS